VLVGSQSDNSLIALKRMGVRSDRATTVQLDLPRAGLLQLESVEVYIMSDVYIGFDQVVSMPLRDVSGAHQATAWRDGAAKLC
jgi:hypothetical protein